MMMHDPKKKPAAVIVGAMLKAKKPGMEDHSDFVDRGDGPEEEGEYGGQDKDVALEEIADDIIKAVAVKDKKALSMALSHFWYICDEDQDEQMMEQDKAED